MNNTLVSAPDAFSLSEGAVFHDQYEVVRRIDSGAMGTVYEVIDRRTKRRRALKIMLARFADNADVTERFRREATITADVVSEHVVETFDAGVDKTSGLPFLVMELLRGEDLGKLLARGPLPSTEVVTFLIQAASALDRMHEAGIIHRDLKPENIFLTRRDDGAPRIKILDFGIAKVIEKTATSATSTRNMGTPVYMSPEQVTGAGAVGPSADLYALGHLAYTMLTGEAYWLEDALAHETVYPLLLRIMEGVQEPASERAARTRKVALSPEFDAWFAKATAHDPDARFQRATDSVVALATALDVPRPALPSWTLEGATALAPTLAPPDDDDDDEPVLLVPTPPARPVATPPPAQEALRTLSPVSTLPETAPAPTSVQARPNSRRALVPLGAAFFAVGVLAAILVARSPAPPTRTGTSQDIASPFPSAAAVSPPADPSGTTTAGATSPDDAPPPSTTASAAPTGASSVATATSAAATSIAKPPIAPHRPLTKTRQPALGSSAPRPTSTYGDPSRDL